MNVNQAGKSFKKDFFMSEAKKKNVKVSKINRFIVEGKAPSKSKEK